MRRQADDQMSKGVGENRRIGEEGKRRRGETKRRRREEKWSLWWLLSWLWSVWFLWSL